MNFWTKIFLVNWAINILFVEFLCIRKLKNIINVDEKRDSRYPAFRRTDVKWFNRAWLFPLCHFFVLKMVLIFGWNAVVCIIIKIISIGWDTDKAFTGWRMELLKALTKFSALQMLFLNGIFYKTSRPDVCYKKFLGPNWTPDYDGFRTGTLVGNHSSLYDASIHTLTQMPCFVSKAEVLDVPFIGSIGVACGSMFIRRDSKNSIQDSIIER